MTQALAIRSIETPYKGIKFRSRLEARWAVFFDELGIDWQYEVEEFILKDGTRYVPDFWLPTFNKGMWVEVKPEGGDFTKAEKFAEECGYDVWYAEGYPSFSYQRYYCHLWEDIDFGLPNWGEAQFENRMYFGAEAERALEDFSIYNLLGESGIKAAAEYANSYRFDY